ncbi:phage head protein [Rhodobacteraceae bacterium M382]|nr:phage head protein [Rhodobacteraceae bacterium M382]
MPDTLRGTFRKPFKHQVAAFRLRLGNLVATSRWDDIERNAHDRAFMVAGVTKADLLADLGAAIDRAITEGTGFEAFKRDFRSIVERQGWHGWTGEGTPGGENWRMRVIYRTNMRVSYQAGRFAQLREGGYKYWIYRHGGSLDPRPEHLALDGLILEPDHPFWMIWFPPNGWGCSCRVFGARSLAGAVRRGGDPSVRLPAGWNTPDPKTNTPKGIDKGWDYAPGASASDLIREVSRKSVKWPNVLSKEFMTALPDQTVDDFARAYRQQPSLITEVRRYSERVLGERGGAPIRNVIIHPQRTLGRLTSSQVNKLARLDVNAAGFDFSIEPDSIRHIASEHMDRSVEATRGQRAVTPADIALMATLLDGPGAITDLGLSSAAPGGRLIQKTVILGNETWHIVFETRRRKRMLVLKTFYITSRRS